MGLIWPSSRIVCFVSSSLPPPRDMVKQSRGWIISPPGVIFYLVAWGWLLKPDLHSGSLRVSGESWHRPAKAQPVLIDHTNDDGFPPLCHLITSCPEFYHHFPGQSRPPPTPAHKCLFFFPYSVSPRTEPIKELTHVSTLHPFNYKQCWELNNTEQKADLFTPGYKQDYQKQAFRSP